MTDGPVSAVRADDPRAWQIAELSFDPERLAQYESVFAVGNGYFGMRGTPDEGTPAHDPGVVLNGFHETWPIAYPEDAYGLARTGQTIVAAADGSIVRLLVDNEPLDLAGTGVRRFERVLDMRTGVLMREIEWETTRGSRVLVRSRRLASLADRHLAAIDYEVVALDGEARVTVCSKLVTRAPAAGTDDPRRGKGFSEKALVPRDARVHGDGALLRLATRKSGLELGCGMVHRIESSADIAVDAHAEGDGARVVVRAALAAGGSLRLSKFVAYHWAPQARSGDLVGRVERTLGAALAAGYAAVESAHSAEVAGFWRRSDIQLDGDLELQQAVRFNVFSLMQATARAEGLGVAAKGVTGRGYEGHYFWDTEIYVVPFLSHTTPRWAKQVLEFRCGMLGSAQSRA
jgi:alpha,alpha-trehalose phosphorylase